MDSQEPYTFSNARFSNPSLLLTFEGIRHTITPDSSPHPSTMTLHDIFKAESLCYIECCSKLLSVLLPSGGKVLDLDVGSGEFAIGAREIATIAYTGVDRRKEVKAIPLEDERVAFIDDIPEGGEYDVIIVNLSQSHPLPKGLLATNGSVIIRGSEQRGRKFENCWALPYSQYVGVIGLRNTLGECDAVFVASNSDTPIALPSASGSKTVPYLVEIVDDPVQDSPKADFLSVNGKKVPVWNGHPFLSEPGIDGVGNDFGIIQKDMGRMPLEYLGLFTVPQTPLHKHLHVFLYNSDTPNRTSVLMNRDFMVIVHLVKTFADAKRMALLYFSEEDIIGLGDNSKYIELVASRISRVMGFEQTMVDINGSNNLLAKAVSKAYPTSDIRNLMDHCEPNTLVYVEGTRDNSHVYYTNDLGKKVPSLVVSPDFPKIKVREYSQEERKAMIMSSGVVTKTEMYTMEELEGKIKEKIKEPKEFSAEKLQRLMIKLVPSLPGFRNSPEASLKQAQEIVPETRIYTPDEIVDAVRRMLTVLGLTDETGISPGAISPEPVGAGAAAAAAE